MQAFEEAQLIAKARRGSDAAFTELVQAYQDRLYRFLRARAASTADAEDALQECFVNAYRYLSSYNSRWQFSTWLYRIALRELGKVSRANTAAGEVADPVAGAADPLLECIREDDRDNLWLLARAGLNEPSYTALWLRYAEDLPIREVARIMGRPQTWVKVVLHRARKKLAAKVATADPAPAGSDRRQRQERRPEATRMNAETT